jgi:methylmalonyl-CoA carboxyltransferase large subunit
METNETTAELAALKAQMALLQQRLDAMEKKVAEVEGEAEVDEETLVILAAAVAAYLGKRAPIRHIRLKSSGAWAQQGRASIQASHGLHVNHER